MIGFPFSAIVGQEAMKTALLIAAVDPTIGGVLIRGHKGTAKTTTVRGFTGVLPTIETVRGDPYNATPDEYRRRTGTQPDRVWRPAPFVELPLGATEDRLIGSLRVESALSEGRREFEPGLLAAAHRGVLYVDEVNLLDDYLVDVLLDAAASGFNIVEREGISVTHPARFVLVGTMNPEEGELRPQFLDRFALCASVAGIADKAARLTVAKRRVEFEFDRAAFVERWKADEEALRQAVTAARERLKTVSVPDGIWDRAVSLSIRAGSEGHRADIALVKAARTLAALTESDAVEIRHLVEAARFVFPHRMPVSAAETVEAAAERLDDLLGSLYSSTLGSTTSGDGETSTSPTDRVEKGEARRESSTPDSDVVDNSELMQVPGAAASGSLVFDFLKKKRRSN